MYMVFRALDFICNILDIAIVLWCLLSWFRPNFKFYDWLCRFVEPMIAPFRGAAAWLMRKTGLPLDISPVLALIALNVARSLIWKLYYLF